MSDKGKTYKHDSFGSIYAAHQSGSGKRLFMSPHNRHHSVVVRVGRSQLTRDLSHDFFHGGIEDIVEVEMSAAQWAHFVSSPNQGTGTPCTLRYYRDGRLIQAPEPPEVGSTRETFSEELSARAKRILAGVQAALASLDRLLAGGPVKKGDLETVRSDLSKSLANDVDGGMGYTMRQAEEWLDKMVNEARSEAEAALMIGMRRIALDAIAQQMTPEEREAATRALLDGPKGTA